MKTIITICLVLICGTALAYEIDVDNLIIKTDTVTVRTKGLQLLTQGGKLPTKPIMGQYYTKDDGKKMFRWDGKRWNLVSKTVKQLTGKDKAYEEVITTKHLSVNDALISR